MYKIHYLKKNLPVYMCELLEVVVNKILEFWTCLLGIHIICHELYKDYKIVDETQLQSFKSLNFSIEDRMC